MTFIHVLIFVTGQILLCVHYCTSSSVVVVQIIAENTALLTFKT